MGAKQGPRQGRGRETNPPKQPRGGNQRSGAYFSAYLHEHLESVQGGRAGSGYGPGPTSSHEVSPPHPRLPLLHRELIGNGQILTHIKDLQGRPVKIKQAGLDACGQAAGGLQVPNLHRPEGATRWGDCQGLWVGN